MLAVAVAPADAAPASRQARDTDFAADFRALAQQRPWSCPAHLGAAAHAAWPDGEALCAWQNRLRRHSWSWSDTGPPPCLSQQARWWSRAQAGLSPAALRSVWDTRWTAQTAQFSVGDERRLLLVRRDGEGRWLATEWRWNPNPRPATRRWQEERWKLLVDFAARHANPSPAPATPDTARLQAVLRKVLGVRPGEAGPDGMALESAGQCLRAGNPLPGQPTLALSYSPSDTRLEQRSAMHLQLSRQNPNAKWLTPFRLVTLPPSVPSGAKFLATWVEDHQLIGQLWMPVKGDAPTVRMRIGTRLPRGQGVEAFDAAASKAKQAVERELEAIAAQWALAYE